MITEEARRQLDNRIKYAGREYRKFLKVRDKFEEFLALIPEELENIPKVRFVYSIYSSSASIYVILQYEKGRIKQAMEILQNAGWKTREEDKIHEAQENVFIHYYHDGCDYTYNIILNIETPKQIIQEDGQVCVLVPIEWETQLKAKTYDRLCPESHPQLFKDGKYIGDELFPAMPEV